MNLQDKAQSTVVLIRAEGMGQGERELQLKLIGTYFKLLDRKSTRLNSSH